MGFACLNRPYMLILSNCCIMYVLCEYLYTVSCASHIAFIALRWVTLRYVALNCVTSRHLAIYLLHFVALRYIAFHWLVSRFSDICYIVDGAHARTQRFTCSHVFMFASSAWTGDGARSGLDSRRSTLGQATSLDSRRSTRTRSEVHQKFTCSHVFMFISSAWTGDGALSGQAMELSQSTQAWTGD